MSCAMMSSFLLLGLRDGRPASRSGPERSRRPAGALDERGQAPEHLAGVGAVLAPASGREPAAPRPVADVAPKRLIISARDGSPLALGDAAVRLRGGDHHGRCSLAGIVDGVERMARMLAAASPSGGTNPRASSAASTISRAAWAACCMRIVTNEDADHARPRMARMCMGPSPG